MVQVVGAEVVGRVVEQVVQEGELPKAILVVVAAEGPFDSFLGGATHAQVLLNSEPKRFHRWRSFYVLFWSIH